MDLFANNFKRDAFRYLADLRSNLSLLQKAKLDEPKSRQIFRQFFQTIHTIKGSAAIFELQTISSLAHKLEDLISKLQSNETAFNQTSLDALATGIDQIEKLLIEMDSDQILDSLVDFSTAIVDSSSTASKIEHSAASTDEILPAKLRSQINEREKERLETIFKQGESIFVFEVPFAIAEFQIKLRKLHDWLLKKGEIISTLPGDNQTLDKLVLQILFAGILDEATAQTIVGDFNGRILFFKKTQKRRVCLVDVCATAFKAGQQIAKHLGKMIEFDLSGKDLQLSSKQSDALSVALLHLVRNALTHGIELTAERAKVGKPSAGKIRIEAKNINEGIELLFADDGRGVDLEKVAQNACSKLGLKVSAAELENADIAEIICSPGFSTAAEITEYAGRGVGLDAVKNAIECNGGTIEIKSQAGRGMSCRIFLPAA